MHWSIPAFRNGFGRKSTAPAFITRAHMGMLPWPVIKMSCFSATALNQCLLDIDAIKPRHPNIDDTQQGPGADYAPKNPLQS